MRFKVLNWLNWAGKRNHEPHQQGVWFKYTGFRFKDIYDIRLEGGSVLYSMRPSGDRWYGYYGNTASVHDSAVSHVRPKPDWELDRFHAKGRERIEDQLKLFGPRPSWWKWQRRWWNGMSTAERRLYGIYLTLRPILFVAVLFTIVWWFA
jgi:hypothetical protein